MSNRIHPDIVCSHGEVDALCPICTPEGAEAFHADLMAAYLEVA